MVCIKFEASNEAYVFNKNITTYFWDENSTNEQNVSFILDTIGEDDDEFDRFPDDSSIYRRGAFQNGRRFFDTKTFPVTKDQLGPDINETDISVIEKTFTDKSAEIDEVYFQNK